MEQLTQRGRALVAALPSNRAYFNARATDVPKSLVDRA